MEESLSPLVRITTCRWTCSHIMALLEMRTLHVAACCWGWLHTLSVTLFQLRNIKCFTCCLRMVQVHCFKSETFHVAVCYWEWHHTLSGTVSNQGKMHVAVVRDCFLHCQVGCFNTVEDTLIHFQVMLPMRKHGRSGITMKKKSGGQGGQHHHKREKEFDEIYGIYCCAYLCTMDRSV